VTVDGSIDRSCASRVIRSLREIKKDKQVKAVVLRVDSPGGSVVSSEAILEEIKLLDKVRTFPFASARTIRREEGISAARVSRLSFLPRSRTDPDNSPSYVRCRMPQPAADTTSR
jgi:hypothetical protein